MDRKDFLKTILSLPLASSAMQLTDLHKLGSELSPTNSFPVMFYGHGSPMNAIEQNQFTKGWEESVKNLPKPNAVLCISAHWETKGTFVTAMEQPRTIHDFMGFPKELFDVEYPAKGMPSLAKETKAVVKTVDVGMDNSWGLDHGCWSVAKHLYPTADIPVLQLSLDYSRDAAFHYQLAKELSILRQRGVLIIGSGNMVHNLGLLDWNKSNSGFDWAEEANALIRKLIQEEQHDELIRYGDLGRAVKLAVPTPEHYLPLLYVLGLKSRDEKISFFNDQTVMGSISMTSLKIEKA